MTFTHRAADEAFHFLARLEASARASHAARSSSKAAAENPADLLAAPPGMFDPFNSWQDAAEQYDHFAGWVYSSIRPIAQRIAGQPLHLARVVDPARTRGKSPRTFDKQLAPGCFKQYSERLEPIHEHRLLDLLRQPNEFMVSWSLLYLTITSLELTGRAYWWLRPRDRATGIYPLPAHWVSQRPGDAHRDRTWQVRLRGQSETVDVPYDEILYFHYPDPADPLAAVSPLQTQSRAVRADESIQAAQDHAFRNGIRPGYALVAGDAVGLDGEKRRPVLSKDQRQQLITAIRQLYRGVTRWDEPLILDGLITGIHKITSTPSEMDFLNSGRTTKERITQGFGTNPIILGEIEGANRAASLVAREHFCEFTINPKIELLSQILTRFVAPRFARSGEQLLLWIEPCHAIDPEQTRKDEEHLLKAGAMSVNELRARHGLAPLEGGDIAWMPKSVDAVSLRTQTT